MHTMSASTTQNRDVKLSNRRKDSPDHSLTNPCWKEYNQSLQCMERNLYNHDSCEMHFENYRQCKRFWAGVVSKRKSNNITPYLPPPEEREEIKAEYIKSQKR